MNNKGADQAARMRSLVCVFVVRMQQNQLLFCVFFFWGGGLWRVGGVRPNGYRIVKMLSCMHFIVILLNYLKVLNLINGV